MGNPSFFYTNSFIAAIAPGGASPRVLTKAFDEDPNLVDWTPAGIHFAASQRTWSYLFTVDPGEKDHQTRGSRQLDWRRILDHPDGASVAFVGSANGLPRRLRGADRDDGGKEGQRYRRADRIVAEAPARSDPVEEPGRREIEGVLHKPADFQAGRRYPLLVVIHGGPPASRGPCRTAASAITRSMHSLRRAHSCSNRTIAAAPATANGSVR